MLGSNSNRIWTGPECLLCLISISYEILKMTTEDTNTQLVGMKKTYDLLRNFSINDLPTELANRLYRMLINLTRTSDPYKEIKKQSNNLAKQVIELIRPHIEERTNPYESFRRAVAASIAGNMIDFGTAGHSIQLDIHFLKNCYYQIIMDGFAIDDTDRLFAALKKGSEVLFIADNAGEVFFDLFLLNILKKSKIKTLFVVKSGPVSNDATMEDVSDPFFKAAATKVMTTGTNALGVSMTESSQEFLKSLQTADLIIAKGQSNFETLFFYAKQLTDKPIYFLFRAKCPAIAHFLGQTVGKNIVMLRKSD